MTIDYINTRKPFLVELKSGTKGDHKKPTPYTREYWVERDCYFKWDPPRDAKNVPYERYDSAESFYRMSHYAYNDVYTALHNGTLEKLLEQLDVCQNLFESWYERQQTYRMLASAGSELYRFLRNWRNPSYWARVAKGVKQPSTLPEAWLAYQFGIKPLIGTVDSCLNGLGQPLTAANFSARSSKRIRKKIVWNVHTDFIARLELGCTVAVNPNPNSHLLNLGGLTTPLSTAWSVIPWGWAVDYFFNVSQLLSNLEVRHPGVIVTNGYTTITMKNGRIFGSNVRTKNGIPWFVVDGTFQYMNRKPTIDLQYHPELSFPMLGSNKIANLFSAIALSMKK